MNPLCLWTCTNKRLTTSFNRRTYSSFSDLLKNAVEIKNETGLLPVKTERPFIDRVVVKLKGGDGGSGCLSFTREKYRRRGPAWGGDGGKGGDIIIQASENVHDLYSIKHKYFGNNGESGAGKSRQGKNGKDIVISVPVGTLVKFWNEKKKKSAKTIIDLHKPNQSIVIVKGGSGGRGNQYFSSSTERTPMIKEQGTEGQQISIELELKIIADIGLVGFPNVGKSSILNIISRASPAVASYAFTTLRPYIGVVEYKDYSQVKVADLPGIIEDAHKNRGLGHEFLKHIERTKALCYVLDMSNHELDPFKEFSILQKELKKFNPDLLERRSIIVANKMDMPHAKSNYQQFLHKILYSNLKVVPISAKNNENIENLKQELYNLLFIKNEQ